MKRYSKQEIKKYQSFSAKELNDVGICPTCFNKASGGKLFGNDTDKTIFEDKDIVCLLVSNPRADGHMIITTKKHFHDMSECDDRINKKIVCFAKKIMKIICEVYGCERVYLCTMCDGPMNHYHVQLIPRYSFEERGSKNFVKPRKEFVYDKNKIDLMKAKINDYQTKHKRSNL